MMENGSSGVAKAGLKEKARKKGGNEGGEGGKNALKK
jgi:hypothetical protein